LLHCPPHSSSQCFVVPAMTIQRCQQRIGMNTLTVVHPRQCLSAWSLVRQQWISVTHCSVAQLTISSTDQIPRCSVFSAHALQLWLNYVSSVVWHTEDSTSICIYHGTCCKAATFVFAMTVHSQTDSRSFTSSRKLITSYEKEF